MQMRPSKEEGGIPVLFLLRSLLYAYILTVALLALLALLLYKMNLTEKPVAIGIILIYVVSTLFIGFLAGRKMGSRKFFWGLCMGGMYFVVLALMSLVLRQTPDALGSSFWSTLLICGGGGMLGGMLS